MKLVANIVQQASHTALAKPRLGLRQIFRLATLGAYHFSRYSSWRMTIGKSDKHTVAPLSLRSFQLGGRKTLCNAGPLFAILKPFLLKNEMARKDKKTTTLYYKER